MQDNDAMSDSREVTVTTPLGKLATLQWGDREAPPLLALHGWLDNAASFARLAPLLSASRYVIALDLPGHGHSAHLPGAARRYHLVDAVGQVLDAADGLGLTRFDLLGHSLGAGIAALLAAAMPERVAKLMLIEGLGPLADDGSDTLKRWREAHRQHARRRRPRTLPSIDAAVATRVAAGGLDPDQARPIVERNLRATEGGFTWRSDRNLRLATVVRIDEMQVRRLLAGIESPTLVLLAEPTTPYLPSAMMAARARCVADIRVEHMDGSHHLHLDHPDAVAANLLAFFGERRR
jgi:pimeloyl-ACP methyl ester carboxylesterase